MENLIDTLAMFFSLDELCEENDIDKYKVIEYLVDEGLIDLEKYSDEQE